MKLTQTNTISSWLISLLKVLHCDITIHNFFSNVYLFFPTLRKFLLNNWNSLIDLKTRNNILLNKQTRSDEKFGHTSLCREELNMVMERLGMHCDLDGQSVGENEFSWLFDDDELSLEEVQEAFNVFDENKDGFIYPTELQRVLCRLGTKEGSELEKCRRMISGSDENGDGVIDFCEFVKFMEKCFC